MSYPYKRTVHNCKCMMYLRESWTKLLKKWKIVPLLAEMFHSTQNQGELFSKKIAAVLSNHYRRKK